MPVTDQFKPTENGKPTAASGFHAELQSLWSPPPPLKQAGEFFAGVGDGFGQAITEGAKSIAQTVSNPGEAIHKAVEETGKTAKGAMDASISAAHYVDDKVSHGDIKGVVHDAQKTSQAIEHIVSAGIDHLSKMNAHDLGKVVGHDVLPGAIVAVAAPELAGESIALAASAANKISIIAKDAEILGKATNVYESAASKISAISEKIAGLNKNMEALQHGEVKFDKSAVKCMGMPDSSGFEHSKPIRLEKSPVSDAFYEKVEHAKSKLEGWVGDHLKTKGIEVHTVEKLEHFFGDAFARTPGCYNPEDIFATDGTLLAKKGIYIAEKVWHRNDWQKNVDVLFQFHHEVGHAICETLKTDWLSNDSGFGKLFSECWKTADRANSASMVLEKLGTKEARANEVFADLWSHLRFTPHESNTYSSNILKMFRPCLEYMRKQEEGWKTAAELSRIKP
ncbi:MAG TPA: hypothetical protein V6C89_01280 [Drouetiella sp.]